jgi:Flp pilus assembly protein TadD
MAGQTERLLARARDRFTVQDYYGAIYLLEEIVATGRAFADVHHLIGVSLSLLGRPEEALVQFARALELNPRYLEALIHQGLILSELGRSHEAEEAFRRAADAELAGARPLRDNAFKVPMARNTLVAVLRDLTREERR